MNLFNGLTDDQRKAVEAAATGRLKIYAGAGSGKTEVLTRRIIKFLQDGISPFEIVAITYTRKAAAEMKERLVHGYGINAAALRVMHVSTFHSFLTDFLRKDPFGGGINPRAQILSENGRKLILNRILKQFEKVHSEKLLHGPESLGPEQARSFFQEFPLVIGKIRRYLLSPAGFFSRAGQSTTNALPPSSITTNVLNWLFRFYSFYLQNLDELNLLDFDEILIRGYALISDMRQDGQIPRERLFLIDEFQDNNREQLGIVNKFIENRESHLTVVGDEKQSIYRFQGADVDTFRSFRSDNTVSLKENFRSFHEITQFAGEFISTSEAAGGDSRINLMQDAKLGCSPRLQPISCLISESLNQPSEAEVTASFIQGMTAGGLKLMKHERPIKYGDVAVIVSSIRRLPKAFEDALITRGIPYMMSGGFGFYDRSEINEIVAFLRLLFNPRDDHALVKIFTGPLYGIPDSQLASLSAGGRLEKTNLLPHLLTLPEEELPLSAVSFRKLFLDLKEKSDSMGVLDIVYYVLDRAGFLEYAASQKTWLKRKRMENNLSKFIAIARGFEQTGIFTTLRDFLSFLEEILKSDVEEDEAGLGLDEGNALKILTIHKAKGLQFPVVFMPYMKSHTYRKTGLIQFSRDYGLLVKSSEAKDSPHNDALNNYFESEKAAHRLEEHRKLYVAMTRAEELLIFSGLNRDFEREGETLFEIGNTLRRNPSFGKVLPISEWPSVLTSWLSFGAISPEKQEIPVEDMKIDLNALKIEINSLRDFFGKKAIAGNAKTDTADIFSLQELAAFSYCPRRYFYHHSNAEPNFSDQVNDFAAVGNLVHRTLRIYHSEIVDRSSSEIRRQRIREIVSKLVLIQKNVSKDAELRALAILAQYANSDLCRTTPWLVEAEVNVRFQAPSGPFILRGYADRIDRIDYDIKIIDYKTRAFNAEVHDSYRRQMALYMAGAKNGILGEIGKLNFAQTVIVYLTNNEVREEPIEPDLIDFESWAATKVEEIRTETKWAPRSDDKCTKCIYSSICLPAVGSNSFIQNEDSDPEDIPF